MKMNLLRCTQLILSAMDSDEINSINDTTEAQQVVDVLETTYYHIASEVDFPDHWDFFELQPSNDVTRPTLMYRPENVGKIEYIKYDVTPDGSDERQFREIKPMKRETFLRRMDKLDTGLAEIYEYNFLSDTGTFPIRGYNDKDPDYYMVTNDRALIFDNYDSSKENTLVGNKTWCYGNLIPTFERSDTFVPELEPKQFTLFFNESLSTSFEWVKQMPSAKAEQRARRSWNMSGRKKPMTPGGEIYHNYTYNFGRRRP